MTSIFIKNAQVIDPANNTNGHKDLFIQNGLFADSRDADATESDIVIEATSLTAIPGLVDCYARLREPGQEKKATIASEARAALHGGITTLICSPDTDPVIDEPATVELIHRRVQDANYARVFPLAALTQNLAGERVSELATLKEAGCIAASNAELPIVSTKVLRSLMEYASTFGIKLVFIAQDPWLAQNGVMHEGRAATQMGLTGIPVVAETAALAVLIELAWQTNAELHLSRITSRRGIDLIRDAKSRGLPITADTSINHLMLTDLNTCEFNSQCHIIPPLRTQDDRDALRDALLDGTLDAICSDHAPHEPDAKLAPFPSTEPGISGLDLFLPLLLKLARECDLNEEALLAYASIKPAKLFGLSSGSMDIGSPADLVLYDANRELIVDTKNFVSKGKNSPYVGANLRGSVSHCFVGGVKAKLSQS